MQITFVYKLWKFQSESSDQHPRGMGDGIILQFGTVFGLDNHTFANLTYHVSAPLPLDVDPMTLIGIFIVCIQRWFT